MPALRATLLYGFAIFAMFFGSGNLVFPIQIGQTAGSEWLAGFAGLVMTGILLPLSGLFVIKLHRGSYEAFFAEAGKVAGFVLPLFTLSLLGAFGVVPRCITVAFGSMQYVSPELGLMPFSLIFCVLTFFLCLNDRLMVTLLGKWMSPLLLLSLVILTVGAALKAPNAPVTLAPVEALKTGFLTGYQTMDLFAAFFFSSLVFAQIQAEMPDSVSHRDTVRFALKPALFGALLLALVYLGFVALGAHFSNLLTNVEPAAMLPAIALQLNGTWAVVLLAMVMFLSCLTTAVALNNLYARYLSRLLGIEARGYRWVLLATTLVAFLISLRDFRGIAAFLAPMLEYSYPGLIALTVLSICFRKQFFVKKAIFYMATAIACLPPLLAWAKSSGIF